MRYKFKFPDYYNMFDLTMLKLPTVKLMIYYLHESKNHFVNIGALPDWHDDMNDKNGRYTGISQIILGGK